MNLYIVAAESLALIVGLMHSIPGEILIFRHMRKGSIVPTVGSPPLRERHVKILWASWHLVTIFVWGFGTIRLQLSFSTSQGVFRVLVENAIVFSMLSASLMGLVATKATHPGSLGLLGIAVFLWIG